MTRPRQPPRRYPRMARVNELLREILGEELERVDDGRLEMVTVTAVDCERDLRRATVYYDSLQGPEGDEDLLAALAEVRPRLQRAIAGQARLKRTPELAFAPDPVVRSADRIEAVLRDIDPGADDADSTEPDGAESDGDG